MLVRVLFPILLQRFSVSELLFFIIFFIIFCNLQFAVFLIYFLQLFLVVSRDRLVWVNGILSGIGAVRGKK